MLLKLLLSIFFDHQNTLKCSFRDQENLNFLEGGISLNPPNNIIYGTWVLCGPDMQ